MKTIMLKLMMFGFLMPAVFAQAGQAAPSLSGTLGPCQFEGQSTLVKTGLLNSRRLDVSLQCQIVNSQIKQVLVTEWAGENGPGVVAPIAYADAFSDIQIFDGGSLYGDIVLSAVARDGATVKQVFGTYGRIRGDLDNCNGISCGGGNGG